MSKINPGVQVRITVPPEIVEFLKERAEEFGLTMLAYVKNLVIQDLRAVHQMTQSGPAARQINSSFTTQRRRFYLKKLEELK